MTKSFSLLRITKVGFYVAIALTLAGAFILLPSIRSEAQQGSGSGLRISPTRTELALDRGEQSIITQTVKNVTQSPVSIELLLNDFESNDETGEPRLIGDPNEISAYSLREFVFLPDDFDLAPDEEREVSITIQVPEAASPGGYFGSVLYRATPQGGGDGQVALVASVGSLVLLEVPGNITEKIEIKDIAAYINEDKGSLFLQKPNNIGVLIENLGNSFSKPFGKVSVKDWRGNEVFIYELNEGDVKSNILPDSTRLFLDELFNIETKIVNDEQQTDKISPISTPGRYTITGNISHGTTGEVFTVTSTFWYLPSWLIISIVILLGLLIGSAYVFYRRHHRKTTRRR